MVDQQKKTKLIQDVVNNPNRHNLTELMQIELDDIKYTLLTCKDYDNIRFYQGKANALTEYIARLTNTAS